MIQWWIVLALISPTGEVLDAHKKQMPDDVSCHSAVMEQKLPNGNYFVVRCGMVMEN